MEEIKKGDIVRIKKYWSGTVFYVTDIIKYKNEQPIALLKGVTIRIETSSYLADLEIAKKEELEKILKQFENKIDLRTNQIIEENKYDNTENNSTRKIELYSGGKILHLDGDKQYAMKASKVYEKLGLNAIVKNIKESKQPYEIIGLLNKYNPDILVVTGHDGMIKKGHSYNDIYNYRNSKYFVRSVAEARRWEQGLNKLAIFAGACQSYYEAIIEAGANFASSPARILIDFMDPLVIAQKVATTSEYQYITMKQIRDSLKNGERGISGIGAFGKLHLRY